MRREACNTNPCPNPGWYYDKASESDWMALASKSAVARDRHFKDAGNWREIAVRIDLAEAAVKQRKAK